VFKELAALPRDGLRRTVAAVEGLRDEPLRGEQLAAEWMGMRHLRVGRYRVIYAFNGVEFLILVLRVGHRGEVDRQR
jgi:mRNA interferase RelE/StbE